MKTSYTLSVLYIPKNHIDTQTHNLTQRHWRSYLCVQELCCGRRLTGPRACRAVWCGAGWR